MANWYELNVSNDRAFEMGTMMGESATQQSGFYVEGGMGQNGGVEVAQEFISIFWFCRNPGLALPLIAASVSRALNSSSIGLVSRTDQSAASCVITFISTLMKDVVLHRDIRVSY